MDAGRQYEGIGRVRNCVVSTDNEEHANERQAFINSLLPSPIYLPYRIGPAPINHTALVGCLDLPLLDP